MVKLCIIAVVVNIVFSSIFLIASLGDAMLSSLYFILVWIWFNLYLFCLRW